MRDEGQNCRRRVDGERLVVVEEVGDDGLQEEVMRSLEEQIEG